MRILYSTKYDSFISKAVLFCVLTILKLYGTSRYQCWGSGSADPCLRLMDPVPDPTPFFSDFRDAKFFFSYPQAHYL
jgi:hypothetical protein